MRRRPSCVAAFHRSSASPFHRSSAPPLSPSPPSPPLLSVASFVCSAPPPPPRSGRQTNSKLEDCVAKLDALGLEPSNPLYHAAFDIFGQSTLLRETWLMMRSDPVELKEWILRTAIRLWIM